MKLQFHPKYCSNSGHSIYEVRWAERQQGLGLLQWRTSIPIRWRHV